MRRILTVIALVISGLLVNPVPAQAARPVTWIYTPSRLSWPITPGATLVNQYSRSELRWGACRAGSRCIIIHEGRCWAGWCMNAQTGAMTFFGTGSEARIVLNPAFRNYPAEWRKRIMAHELGHAMGIRDHSMTCDTVMHWHTVCNGTGGFPSWRFTGPERDILARY